MRGYGYIWRRTPSCCRMLLKQQICKPNNTNNSTHAIPSYVLQSIVLHRLCYRALHFPRCFSNTTKKPPCWSTAHDQRTQQAASNRRPVICQLPSVPHFGRICRIKGRPQHKKLSIFVQILSNDRKYPPTVSVTVST
jgi:hypothetical protein